jgi:hypothetical protein
MVPLQAAALMADCKPAAVSGYLLPSQNTTFLIFVNVSVPLWVLFPLKITPGVCALIGLCDRAESSNKVTGKTN